MISITGDAASAELSPDAGYLLATHSIKPPNSDHLALDGITLTQIDTAQAVTYPLNDVGTLTWMRDQKAWAYTYQEKTGVGLGIQPLDASMPSLKVPIYTPGGELDGERVLGCDADGKVVIVLPEVPSYERFNMFATPASPIRLALCDTTFLPHVSSSV